jgi:hypothetical protein
MRPPMYISEYSPETQRLWRLVGRWYWVCGVPAAVAGVLGIMFPYPAKAPTIWALMFALVAVSLGFVVPMFRATRRFRRAGFKERAAKGC